MAPGKVCGRCKTLKAWEEFSKSSSSKDGYQGMCKLCMRAHNKEYYDRTKDARKKYHQARRRKQRRAQVMAKWHEEHPDATRTYRARMRAKEYDPQAASFSEQEWTELQEAYQHTCLGCLQQFPDGKLEADHVLPLDRGGTNVIDNIQPLCVTCNRKKGTRHIDFRPRWHKIQEGQQLDEGIELITATLRFQREVEGSLRWTSEEYGVTFSLRMPKDLIPKGELEKLAYIRVTVEPLTEQEIEEETEEAEEDRVDGVGEEDSP